MPKRDVAVISHSALTNHRIIAYAGEPLKHLAAGSDGELIHVNPRPGGAPLSPLTWLAAYGELLAKDPAVQSRYLRLLDQLERDEPNNGVVQAALGSKALRAKSSDSNAKAISHLTKALELGFSGTTVYADLAEGLSRDGRPQEAVDVLHRGISSEPYAPELYKSLALRYISLKNYAHDEANHAALCRAVSGGRFHARAPRTGRISQWRALIDITRARAPV
jgi:predicted Zn-dependent protease